MQPADSSIVSCSRVERTMAVARDRGAAEFQHACAETSRIIRSAGVMVALCFLSCGCAQWTVPPVSRSQMGSRSRAHTPT